MFDTLLSKVRNLHKSVTAWFNAAMALVAFGIPELLSQLPAVAAYVPAPTYGKVLLATILGNIVLRFKTRTALEYK